MFIIGGIFAIYIFFAVIVPFIFAVLEGMGNCFSSAFRTPTKTKTYSDDFVGVEKRFDDLHSDDWRNDY